MVLKDLIFLFQILIFIGVKQLAAKYCFSSYSAVERQYDFYLARSDFVPTNFYEGKENH